MNLWDDELAQMLAQGVKKLNLALNGSQLSQLLSLAKLLLKWNKVYNLTGITDPHRIISHHILDSLSIVPYIQGSNIIDVGAGAGFPGLPCAIALPDYKFTLLDSNGKKTRFMTQAVGELQLKNVIVVQSRVESYRTEQCFNTLTARAFAATDKLLMLTSHLLCQEGQLLLMKGLYPKAELQKISFHAKVTKLSVPYVQEERHLVTIKRASQ